MPSRFLRPLAGVLLLMLALLPAAPARGADDAGSRVPCEFPEADRIVAIGSVFGQYHGFRALLGEMGLIDEQGDWIGGTAHLVQFGNLYGSGPSLDDSIRLLMKLEKQAAAAGGMVHVLHGKAENMMLGGYLAPVNRGPNDTGYVIYASPSGEKKRKALLERFAEAFDRYAAGDEQIQRQRSLFLESIDGQISAGGPEYLERIAPGAEMGDWLRTRNVVIRIGELIFSPAGISEAHAERPLAEINEQFHRELRDDLIWVSARVDMKGPLWWPELLTRHQGEMRPRVEWILHKLGARAMVVGHSPVLGGERRGRVYHVDSRLDEPLDAVPIALEIVGGRFLSHQGDDVTDLGAPPPLPDEPPPAPRLPKDEDGAPREIDPKSGG